MDDKDDLNLAGVLPSAEPRVESNDVNSNVDITDVTAQHRATGPRTATGKRISSRNALKEGFFSKELVRWQIREIDRTSFSKLLNRLIREHSAVGTSEIIQMELMAVRLYQLKQLFRVTNALRGNCGVKSMSELVLGPTPDASGFLEDVPTPEVFEKVQRCERHILREYYRARAELERLQALRLGVKVPPRIHVEVD